VDLKGESLIAIQEYLCKRCNRFFRYPCLGKGRYGFVGWTRLESLSAWFKAIRHVYPSIPIQGCVVHMERIIDRLMPRRSRTVKQEELKILIRRFLYASSLAETNQSLQEIKSRRDEWVDDRSRQAINSIIAHRKVLATHFSHHALQVQPIPLKQKQRGKPTHVGRRQHSRHKLDNVLPERTSGLNVTAPP